MASHLHYLFASSTHAPVSVAHNVIFPYENTWIAETRDLRLEMPHPISRLPPSLSTTTCIDPVHLRLATLPTCQVLTLHDKSRQPPFSTTESTADSLRGQPRRVNPPTTRAPHEPVRDSRIHYLHEPTTYSIQAPTKSDTHRSFPKHISLQSGHSNSSAPAPACKLPRLKPPGPTRCIINKRHPFSNQMAVPSPVFTHTRVSAAKPPTEARVPLNDSYAAYPLARVPPPHCMTPPSPPIPTIHWLPRATKMRVEDRSYRKGIKYKNDSFPMKLHRLLLALEASGQGHIASFTKDGKSFTIGDKKQLEAVLPEYFRHGKFLSFKRLLYMYGFERNEGSWSAGTFSHPDFQRHAPEKCREMLRRNSTAEKIKKEKLSGEALAGCRD